MGDKSTQKKLYIVEKAREVFAACGYKNVTMKDIVEACQISRGGLYLYYANTRELFETVFEQETHRSRSIYEESVQEDATPGDKLLLYLDVTKRMLFEQDSLAMAMYEYLFDNQGDNPVSRSMMQNTELLEKIISEGVEQEWMVCDDPEEAAQNITYTLQGLQIASRTTGVTENSVDKTIEYIMASLGLAVE